MGFSTTNAGLPLSRTDTLSVVALTILGALVGATAHKPIAYVVTALANIYALVCTAITFHATLANPYGIEDHLWTLTLGLLILTFITSLLALLPCRRDNIWVFLSGMAVVLSVPVVGLAENLIAYAKGCDHAPFAASALCEHSTGYVVGVVVGIGVLGLVLACFLTVFSSSNPFAALLEMVFDLDLTDSTDEFTENESLSLVIVLRTSALAKACLLVVYLCLVYSDLRLDKNVHGNDMHWWATGQWAKQSAAIANIVLNHVY